MQPWPRLRVAPRPCCSTSCRPSPCPGGRGEHAGAGGILFLYTPSSEVSRAVMGFPGLGRVRADTVPLTRSPGPSPSCHSNIGAKGGAQPGHQEWSSVTSQHPGSPVSCWLPGPEPLVLWLPECVCSERWGQHAPRPAGPGMYPRSGTCHPLKRLPQTDGYPK